MSTKLNEVYNWLNEVFKDAEVPDFEDNEDNINILHRLMKSYNGSFEDVECIMKEFNNLSKAYDMQARQLKQSLELMGLTEDNLLDSEDKSSFNSFSDVAYNVGLSTPLSSNIIPVIHSLEKREREVNHAMEEERKKTKELLKISEAFTKDLSSINSVSEKAAGVNCLQNEELSREVRKSEFLEEKIENYTTDIKNMEIKLKCSGYDENITHGVSEEKLRELQNLEQKLENATNTLESYTLPPDMSLAELKVEEARQMLEKCVRGISDNN